MDIQIELLPGYPLAHGIPKLTIPTTVLFAVINGPPMIFFVAEQPGIEYIFITSTLFLMNQLTAIPFASACIFFDDANQVFEIE